MRLAEFQCENHEKRIAKLEESVCDLRESVHEIDKTTSVALAQIGSALEKLECVPTAMQSIEKTMVGIQGEMQRNSADIKEVKENIKCLSDKVEEVDNRDKLSLMGFLKKNAWAILATLFATGLAIAQFSK